ncbi:MAG: NADH-quinone oxidoreductase subunit C [Candidatus Manganitrophus sp.]|nr:NADH-quinone oxidoreductase subunit C [Candidatus Manganitrophus sp.]WDT70982.1 MAG: NADH-quinone oxidoreductase subunit C [Candidatus Manganitrophus sp.]WDT81744.1 MAG: NADH-quinone oxidoreductase subunit C [Candidatus Manganitrophus sp.]
MKIPSGMEDGGEHPVARKIQAQFPAAFIGATLFRGDLSIHLKKEGLFEIGRLLRDDPALDFDYPVHVSSVDHMGERERFEVVYEFFSIRKKHQVRLKTRVSEEECTVDSLTPLWEGLNFMEREVYDMMGIKFNNHPDLRRILLPDEYDEGYPLRKNFPIEGRGWRDTFEFLES